MASMPISAPTSSVGPLQVLGPHCQGCPQEWRGVRRVPPDGTGANGVLIAGDSPFDYEVAAGIPFVGPSGKLLDRVFGLLGVNRGDFLITNAALQCRPLHLGWSDKPERYPEAASAMHQCRPYFDEVVERMKPKVIVTLGNTALQRVCGVSGLEDRHAYLHPSSYGVPVIPSYHPSYILQGNQKLIPVLSFALRRSLELASGSLQEDHFQLELDPPVGVLERYLALAKGKELMVDVETPESGTLSEEEAEEDASYTLIRIGFSTDGASAVTVPWCPPYSEVALRGMQGASCLLFWNQNYDLPRLQRAGLKLAQPVVDAMWAWHFLQSDLPKALGFVAPFFYAGPPWKHLSQAQPAFYNAMDAAVQMLCYRRIRAALEKEGRLAAFERHCVRVSPILAVMGRSGILVNQTSRQAFIGRLGAERDQVNTVIQSLVPDAARPRKLYKRPPKNMEGVVALAGSSVEAASTQEAAVFPEADDEVVLRRIRTRRKRVSKPRAT